MSDGLHEAIIDEETFAKAQIIRKTRSHPPSNTGKIENPLAGLVKCNVCGKKLVRQNLKRKYNQPRLICNTKGCVRSILVEHVEKRVYDEILKFIKECEYGFELKPNMRAENICIVIQGLEKQLKTLQTQKSSLHDLLEQGVYDINTFMERKNKLQDEIFAIEKKMHEQEQFLELEQNSKTKLDLLPYAKLAAETYWNLDAPERNKLLKQFILEIIYEKSKTERNDEFYLQVRYAFE